jgi:hypothetical protein
MRTLAAAMSAYYHLSEHLYAETKTLLETHSQTPATPRDKIPLEHIQAWLLLSHYDLCVSACTRHAHGRPGLSSRADGTSI